MIAEPNEPEAVEPAPTLPRLFLHEPGWRIAQKFGSEKEYCYMTAPGQDYYHRLLDGEVYLFHGDEKLCLRCAARRGLLSFDPKRLLDEPVLIASTEPPYDLGPPRS
jgi:hypothetical protein